MQNSLTFQKLVSPNFQYFMADLKKNEKYIDKIALGLAKKVQVKQSFY